MCTFICIETFFCLCAKVKLLRKSFAFVQYEYYSVPPLLIVQSRFYWISRLLRCNHLLTCGKTLIDTISCLCAARWLLNISYCLYAIVFLLNIFLACVQWPTYWLSWLLMCRRNVIEYFVCSCALTCLLSARFAWMQLQYCWVVVPLICKRRFIDPFHCLDAILPLLRNFFAYVCRQIFIK